MCKHYCKIEHKWCKYCRKAGCLYNNRTKAISLNSFNTCPKRAAYRTISFKEILANANFEDIMVAMYKYWPNEIRNYNGYLSVFNKLKTIKPVKNNWRLYARRLVYDDGTAISIYACPMNSNKSYNISFNPWNEWLYMDIDPGLFNNNEIDYYDFIAGCLYEMTFSGFDEKTIQSDYADLIGRFKKNENKNNQFPNFTTYVKH